MDATIGPILLQRQSRAVSDGNSKIVYVHLAGRTVAEDHAQHSISFRVGGVASVVLFDHYGGPFRVIHALAYAAFREGQLEAIERPAQWPPGNVVMVDYIRHAAVEMDIVGLYLGKDERDGYNSGFGHWVIDLDGDLPAQLTQAITDLGPPSGTLAVDLWVFLGFTGNGRS